MLMTDFTENSVGDNYDICDRFKISIIDSLSPTLLFKIMSPRTAIADSLSVIILKGYIYVVDKWMLLTIGC